MFKKSGFTLLEILIVISIIGILAGMVLAGFGAARRKARIAKAKSEMLNLGTAVINYNGAHKDDFDPNNRWPKNVGTPNLNKVPQELKDGAFWRGSVLTSGVLYARTPCNPIDGERIDETTLELVASDGTLVHWGNPYICAATPDPQYVGIEWAGLDGDIGTKTDNFLLLIYSDNQETYYYQGEKLFRMGGQEEACDPQCSF